jgi:hypothetical protein
MCLLPQNFDGGQSFLLDFGYLIAITTKDIGNPGSVECYRREIALPLPCHKTYSLPEMLLKIQAVTCNLRGFFRPHPIHQRIEFKLVVRLWLRLGRVLVKRR